METNIFDFLAELEKDIADFYESLKPMAQLAQNNEIFEYMKNHSNGHSREVESFRTKYKKPEFDRQFFLNMHGQIKKSLKEEILSSGEAKTMLDKMAKSEELVGKLYRVLAVHYKKLAEYYNSISGDIEHIAAEEDLHRDMILKEKSKY
jgi:hypothetical protein